MKRRRMLSLGVLCLSCALGSAMLSFPVEAQAKVLLADCGYSAYGGKVAPRKWDAGCTGDPELIRTAWSRWGRAVAIGKGKTVYNDCDPDCARGTTYKFRARARVWRIRVCKNQNGKDRRFYMRVRLTYWVPADHPSGLEKDKYGYTFKQGCVK